MKQPHSARTPSPVDRAPARRVAFRANTRTRGLTKKQTAKQWAATRAVIAARGGPVREPPTDVKHQFEQFKYNGGPM